MVGLPVAGAIEAGTRSVRLRLRADPHSAATRDWQTLPMQRPGWQRLVERIAGPAVPLLAGAYVVAVVAGALQPGIGITSHADLSTPHAVLAVVAGAGLVAAGVVAWILRRRTIGLLAMAAGACWFGADWAGAVALSPGLRSLALGASLMTLPLLVHLVLHANRVDASPTARRTLALVYGGIGALGLAWMATYVPWNDPDCLALCDASGGPFGDRSMARVFAAAWQILTAVAGIGLALWAGSHYAGASGLARRGALRTVLPAMIVGLAWAYWAIALLFPSSAVPPTGWVLASAFVARGSAMLLLAIGLIWLLLDGRRTLLAVRRITDQLSPLPGGGSLRTALAGALGDPNLQLVFPLPGSSGSVDAAGAVIAEPPARAGTHLTPIEYGGETVAIAVAAGNAPDVPVTDDLGEAVRLAAANERLLAAVRHEVLELRASRARIVEAGDAARHAIERDLHDGAQHRMLGVLHELSLAQVAAATAGDTATAERLSQAVDEADAAIESLRRLARGIHHATLTEAGLLAALEALADEAPLPVDIDAPVDVRYPAEVEATVWRVVADSVAAADRLGADGVEARVRQVGDRVHLDLGIDGASSVPDTIALADRVGAAGGSLTLDLTEPERLRLHVELPCE